MSDLSKDLESLMKGLQQARDGELVDGPDVDADALPDPPWRVLATCGRASARWWQWESYVSLFAESDDDWRDFADAYELTVVPHPRNDPEAVKIIEDAKQ